MKINYTYMEYPFCGTFVETPSGYEVSGLPDDLREFLTNSEGAMEGVLDHFTWQKDFIVTISIRAASK